ncbi:MAG: hypothetical protein HOA60_14745 [Rhodospirillales bacterium]|nr:hypothetical protein [Rhodospirillales bacterium]
MSENTFRSKRTKLEAKGFPNRIDDLDGTDGDAVERWIDMRSGIGTSVSENAQGLLGTIYDKT